MVYIDKYSLSHIFLSIYCIVLKQNQSFTSNEYTKHVPANNTNVTTGKPKKTLIPAYVNIQAPKSLTKKHGAGALLKRNWSYQLHLIKGQPITVFTTHLSANLHHTSPRNLPSLDSLRYIRATRPNFIFNNIFPIILSKDLFLLTYNSITNHSSYNVIWNPRARKPPFFSFSSFHFTVNQLRRHTYKFSHSFSSLVVQIIIREILLSIFFPCSTPFQSPFSSLQPVHNALLNKKWWVRNTVDTAFLPANRPLLINLIKSRISDPSFILLVSEFLSFQPSTPRPRFQPLDQLFLSHSLVLTFLNIYILPYDSFINRLLSSIKAPSSSFSRYLNSSIIRPPFSLHVLETINLKANTFLTSSLNLPLTHNKIYPSTKGHFLYPHISISCHKGPKIKLKASSLFQGLSFIGFCEQNGTPVPQFNLYKEPHQVIITKYSQATTFILLSLQPFYNSLKLSRQAHYILKKSLSKLLAAKLKL